MISNAQPKKHTLDVLRTNQSVESVVSKLTPARPDMEDGLIAPTSIIMTTCKNTTICCTDP